ncbi:MAG: protein kinase domain-containing protein, partial [Terriglobales bacterium]
KGAMGIVYKAEDPTIGRAVAVKTTRLDVHGMDEEEVFRRFRHEARAAGALHHSNVVTIYDAGQQGELFYIAMEYVEGETLQRLLRQRRSSPREILDVARQICAGLDYAHSHGVIHRDVKPANIIITPDGIAKIMDFGIAKTGGGMTTDGQVLGTPYYMSPEQVRGRPLDGRSDLFCFAVILYEMITGQKPFVGENPNTIIYNIVNEEPKNPEAVDPSISPELSGVLLRALQKNPNHRYATGAELVRELSICLDAGGMAAADARAARMGRRVPERADLQKLFSTTAGTHPQTGSQPAEPMPSPPDPRATVQIARRQDKPAPAEARSARGRQIFVAVVLLGIVLGGYLVYQSRSRAGGTNEPAASGAEPALTVPGEPKPATPPPESAAASGSGTSPASTGTEPPATGEATATSPAPIGTATPAGSAPTRAPASRMVTLSVQSSPEGANIFLDGARTGKTTPARLAVAPGKHTLMLSKEGYQDEAATADLRAGEPFTYAPILKPRSGGVGGLFRKVLGGVPAGKGVIEVRTDPKGATILVNGEVQGKRSNTDLELNPGTYTVLLRLEGHKAAQKRVQVEEGKKVKLEEKLVKE